MLPPQTSGRRCSHAILASATMSTPMSDNALSAIIIGSPSHVESTATQRWMARRRWVSHLQDSGASLQTINAAMADPMLFEELVLSSSERVSHVATSRAHYALDVAPGNSTDQHVPQPTPKQRRKVNRHRPQHAVDKHRHQSCAAPPKRRSRVTRSSTNGKVALSTSDTVSHPFIWQYTGRHVSHGVAVQARTTCSTDVFDTLIDDDPQFQRLFSTYHHPSYISRCFDRWTATGLLETDTEDEGVDFGLFV